MKKAIVIGASSGIGKELAVTLAKNGYEVGLMARRTELLETLKNEVPVKSHIGHIDINKVSDAIDKLRNMIEIMQGVDLVVISSGTQKAAKQIYIAINKQKNHAYITHRWKLIGWALKLMPDWLYQRIG